MAVLNQQLLLVLLVLNQAALFLVLEPLLLPEQARLQHCFHALAPFRPHRQRTALALGGGSLKKAIARCCQGCSGQGCRVHFARNLLVKVPKSSQDMVAGAWRSVFVQQNEPAVEQQWNQVITMLTEKFPEAAAQRRPIKSLPHPQSSSPLSCRM